LIAMADAQGVSRDAAVGLFLPVAIFHIATTLSLGAIAEWVRLKYILIFMGVAQVLSLYGLSDLGDPLSRWCYIAGSGFSWGSFGILINLPWPRFFGRRHLGAINGWVGGATVVTSAVGPFLFGLCNEYFGSFLPAVAICLALCPVVLVAAVFADNPQAA